MSFKQHFINKLRELGYNYVGPTAKTEIWRRPQNTHRVMVPKTKDLSDAYVISTLRQCGCTDAEIADFLRDAKC